MPKKPFFTLTFFGWLAFITFSSLTSFSGIDTGSFDIPYGDKLVHFAFYFIAAVLGVFFLREQGQWGFTQRKAFVVIFISTLVFGIIIEVLQYSLTTYREGELLDGIANGVGSLGGIFAAKYIFSKRGFLQWQRDVS